MQWNYINQGPKEHLSSLVGRTYFYLVSEKEIDGSKQDLSDVDDPLELHVESCIRKHPTQKENGFHNQIEEFRRFHEPQGWVEDSCEIQVLITVLSKPNEKQLKYFLSDYYVRTEEM